MDNKRKSNKWQLIGGIALTIAVAGVTAYVITKKSSEESKKKNGKKSKNKK